MKEMLADKTALITGGTSGIGEATVELFIAEGANVVFTGRDVEKGGVIESRCGPKAMFVQADVLYEDQIRASVEQTLDALAPSISSSTTPGRRCRVGWRTPRRSSCISWWMAAPPRRGGWISARPTVRAEPLPAGWSIMPNIPADSAMAESHRWRQAGQPDSQLYGGGRSQRVAGYGTAIHKQVYIYGGLDIRPTEVRRTFGMAWGMGGWLLPYFLERVGPEKAKELKTKVAAEIKTTFASHYTKVISLKEAVTKKAIDVYSKQATGEKFLINPDL